MFDGDAALGLLGMGTGLSPLFSQHPRKHWILRVHAIPRLHQPCVRLGLAPPVTAHRPRLEHKRRAAVPTMTVDEHRPRGTVTHATRG